MSRSCAHEFILYMLVLNLNTRHERVHTFKTVHSLGTNTYPKHLRPQNPKSCLDKMRDKILYNFTQPSKPRVQAHM